MGGVNVALRGQIPQQNTLPIMVECGNTESSSAQQVQLDCSSYVPTTPCIRTVKVNVTFIQKNDGTGNFTETGSPQNVQDKSTDPAFNSTLPMSYSGHDYANALICKVNNLMDNNMPDNMCSGWYYYTNPFSPYYDPNFQMPDAPPPTKIRFYLNQVRYIKKQ